MLKKILSFVTEDIWRKHEREYKSKKVRWAVRQFKVILFMFQGFGEHSIMARSAALAFYSIVAVVPVAALFFAVAKGFGIEKVVNDYLYAQFPQYDYAVDQFIEVAHAMLERTRGGVIASVGSVVLLWSAMKVFGNIEGAFNSIWEVKKSRSIARMFSDYTAIIFLVPILLTVSNSMILYVKNSLPLADTQIGDWFFWCMSVIAVWLMFAVVYKVMPNTKVKFSSALSAGIIAGSGFQIFQVIYIYIQSSVSTYNAIYGSFAALPLFLIWLQTSWQILLIGAELSFAYQNVGKYEYEKLVSQISYDYRRKINLCVMYVISRHFMDMLPPLSSDAISKELGIPVRMAREALFDLEKASLIVSIYNDKNKVHTYLPALDVSRLTIADVLSRVENNGGHELNLEQSKEFVKIESITEQLNELMKNSPQNIPIVDIKI